MYRQKIISIKSPKAWHLFLKKILRYDSQFTRSDCPLKGLLSLTTSNIFPKPISIHFLSTYIKILQLK